MDWMNRGDRPQNAHQAAAPGVASTNSAVNRNTKDTQSGQSLLRWAFIALLTAGTILLVATTLRIATANTSGEADKLDKKKLQAVFLNGGQVYFGSIGNINDKYLNMSNIYYLRVNQQVQPNQQTTAQNSNDISLVKLGCELHGPQDSMVINREQVIFWENLKDDGQVAKAVAEYVKQNPNGQKCDQPQTTNTTPTTPAPTTPAPTTPPAKKP